MDPYFASLDGLRALTLLSGITALPGEPLNWLPLPGEPKDWNLRWPANAGAILRCGAVIIHRHPHLFLIEPNNQAYMLYRASPFVGTRKCHRRRPIIQPAGPVEVVYHFARSGTSDCVLRAEQIGTPVAGRPNTYAVPPKAYHAEWHPVLLQSPTAPGASKKPMHRLEPRIAQDAFVVEAGRAAAAVTSWIIEGYQAGCESAAHERALVACRRLEGAASRLKAVGGDPSEALAEVVTAYKRLDPTGYIECRLRRATQPENTTAGATA